MDKLTKEEYREHIVETIKQINQINTSSFSSVSEVLKTTEILNSAMKELYMLDNGLL